MTDATPTSSHLPEANVTTPETTVNPQLERQAERSQQHASQYLHAAHLESPIEVGTGTLQAPKPVHCVAKDAAIVRICGNLRSSRLQATGIDNDTIQSNATSYTSSGISTPEVPMPAPDLEADLPRPPSQCRLLAHASSPRPDPTQAIDGATKEANTTAYPLNPIDVFDGKVATRDRIQSLESSYPLPPIEAHKTWTKARYLGFTFYRRLMFLVVLANLIAIAVMIARASRHSSSFTYADAATATGANLLAAILMRQEHVVNLLFHVVCALPHRVPLPIRRNAAKLAYNTGGVHSAAGISALAWYIIYIVLVVLQFESTDSEVTALRAVTAITLLMFVVILIMSHPSLRRKYHDYWELCHRYCGYTAIILVWCQVTLTAASAAERKRSSVGSLLVSNPTFWFIIVITLCLIYPWLWLRRLPVDANQLSTHATELRFHNRNVPTCVGTRLSHLPLVENHGFATIPNTNGEKGYSVIVSNGGNWTKGMIMNPPKCVWQRGAPTTGVMRVSSLFKPIVVVTTGSGIGPCMSFLNVRPDHPMRVVWSARSPEATYGREIFANVLRADRNAVVIDTKKTGLPNLAAIVYALVKEVGAEAVMVISNPKVTKDVVFEMEARKIPAFGAIFDS